MRYSVSFGTDLQSMFYMPTIFLKDNTDSVLMPQFQISYIHDATNFLHNNLVRLCYDVKYMWRGEQYLEFQEWEDCIKQKKTRISAIIMFIPLNN